MWIYTFWLMFGLFTIGSTLDKVQQENNKKEMNQVFQEQPHRHKLKELDNMKKYRRN